MGCLGQGNISRCNFLPLSGKTASAHTVPWNYPIFFSFSFPLLLFFFSPLFFFIFLSLFYFFSFFFFMDMLWIEPGASYTSFSFDVIIGLDICKDGRPVNKVCVCVCVIWWLYFWPYVCWGITGTSWRQSLKVSHHWGVITSFEAFQVVDMGLVVEKFSFL